MTYLELNNVLNNVKKQHPQFDYSHFNLLLDGAEVKSIGLDTKEFNITLSTEPPPVDTTQPMEEPETVQ